MVFSFLFIIKKNKRLNNKLCLDNEEIGRTPFPTVMRQEQEKSLLIKNENNSLREMSPTSQLSQSTDRTNTPSVKDIRRDEPMLGF
jgi:hypothetical protein